MVHSVLLTAVDDFEAVGTSKFNKIQVNSSSSPQQIQHEPLENDEILQVSIIDGIWFGTRGSEVQILSPRRLCLISPLNSVHFGQPSDFLGSKGLA